jgi:hypothetical protein
MAWVHHRADDERGAVARALGNKVPPMLPPAPGLLSTVTGTTPMDEDEASAYTRTLLKLMRVVDPHNQNPAEALCLVVSKGKSRCQSVTRRAARTSYGALWPLFGSPPAAAEGVAPSRRPRLRRHQHRRRHLSPPLRLPLPLRPRLPRHLRPRLHRHLRPHRYLLQGLHSKLCLTPRTRWLRQQPAPWSLPSPPRTRFWLAKRSA